MQTPAHALGASAFRPPDMPNIADMQPPFQPFICLKRTHNYYFQGISLRLYPTLETSFCWNLKHEPDTRHGLRARCCDTLKQPRQRPGLGSTPGIRGRPSKGRGGAAHSFKDVPKPVQARDW